MRSPWNAVFYKTHTGTFMLLHLAPDSAQQRLNIFEGERFRCRVGHYGGEGLFVFFIHAVLPVSAVVAGYNGSTRFGNRFSRRIASRSRVKS